MNKYEFVLFFFVCTSFLSYGQNKTSLIRLTDSIYSDRNAPPESKISELKSILKAQDTLEISERIAHVYHRIGLLYERSGFYNLAIKKYNKAAEIRQEVVPINYYKLNNSLYNSSNCYNALGKKDDRREVLNSILKNKSGDKFFYKAHIYLAYLFANEGDYFKATELLDQVVVSFKTYNDIKTLFYAHVAAISIYSEMSIGLENTPQINFHKKEIEDLVKSNPYLYDLTVYNNLGIIYEKLKIYPEALLNYEVALNGYTQYADSVNMGVVNNNIANLHSKNGQHKKAKTYYNNALKVTTNKNVVADVYDNLGFYLNSEKSIDRLPYYEKALQIILGDSSTVHSLPKLKAIKNSNNKLDILFYLNDMASCLVTSYEEENNLAHLEMARSVLSLIDQVVSLIRYDSSSEKSKLFWISKGVNSYMLGVKVCYLLKDKSRMFYFMEKNKSLLLLENLNNREEKLSANIPKSVLTRAYNLQYDVINITETYRLNPTNESIHKDYLEKTELFSHFSDSIKKIFPDYFEIKRVPKILSLNNARAFHVSKDANFVEYILDDNSGYGIFCSNEETTIFELKAVPELIKNLDLLRDRIKVPFAYAKDFEAYRELSFSVFRTLFPLKEWETTISNKRLTIVPDYKLQYLPFEALITKTNSNDLSKDYLINKTEISYSQSASVFQQIEKKEQTTKQNFIGIAPVSYSYDSLSPLLKSEKEMEQISSLFKSKMLFKEKAIKQSFIENLNIYNIIHVNTHAGLSNNGKPWIAFSDSKLDIKELYGLNNQASLVVLDACKTADGTLEKGEGIMSLSRGFFYGGAKSVIASLWNINEQSNNEILVSFYKNLEKGQKKSEALHNAKLSYLKAHQNSELSPYYWSSLVLTGDVKPLEIVSNTMCLKKVLFLFLIGVISYFIFRKK